MAGGTISGDYGLILSIAISLAASIAALFKIELNDLKKRVSTMEQYFIHRGINLDQMKSGKER